jgi:transcriptional regulator with AAA-type ATPase domain
VRPADVKDLQRYFVRLLSKQNGVTISLTPEAQRQLEAYNWPNNISVRKMDMNTLCIVMVNITVNISVKFSVGAVL